MKDLPINEKLALTDYLKERSYDPKVQKAMELLGASPCDWSSTLRIWEGQWLCNRVAVLVEENEELKRKLHEYES